MGSRFTFSVFDKEMREFDKRRGSQLSSATGRGRSVLSAVVEGMSQFQFQRVKDESEGLSKLLVTQHFFFFIGNY